MGVLTLKICFYDWFQIFLFNFGVLAVNLEVHALLTWITDRFHASLQQNALVELVLL